jgi:hypothetical protein
LPGWDRLRELKDRATQTGMDLGVEHRILLPDKLVNDVHLVAHAKGDGLAKLEYMGVVFGNTERFG